ncbi:MAG TPA: SpoIID/LytB domain-containing protein [Nocardioidaceae bacterium]|nr:SpoIID/LytB domain-containing protein [Nocardioidaceae bacterium]
MRARTPALVAAFTSMLVAAVAVAGATAPADGMTTDQSYWVPVNKQVEIHGHGYGHGHGMSQYGAQGAALQGMSYREIAEFYYPGTSWSKVRGAVRVLITADTTTDVMVSPAAGLSVRDLGTGTVYPLPDRPGVTRWRLNVRGNDTVLGYLTDRWHAFRPGGKRTLVGDGEFLARKPITLWTPSGPRTYRGALRAASPSPGSSARDTVNVLSMDRYVMGVVPYEMPASWSPEAVRAQAVAARTYATWSRNQNRHRYYQICDTTACQVYGGASGEDARSNAAVRATRRQILTYQGGPAFTQFSSSSGGWTAAGSVPYLTAQPDPYDGWDGNPVHDWSLTIDAGRFERSYPSLGTLRRIRVVNRDGNGEWDGRVVSVVLDGTRGDVTISGDEFRWAFGLRSNWFTIEPTPIIDRWNRIGGAGSRLGPVRSKEYRVSNGSAQVFARGRIFYSRATGARELYGPVLRAYRRSGGAGSDLGLPRTTVQPVGNGQSATFQHGAIYHRPRSKAVVLTGKTARRYARVGGVESRLGWPVQAGIRMRFGERVEFEHGRIDYHRKTDRTRLKVTS